MLHPNEDPSEISQFYGGGQTPPRSTRNSQHYMLEPRQPGRLKRLVAWIDHNWLKPLLVNKSQDQIKAADEIDDMIQMIMEDDPVEDDKTGEEGGTNSFLSISPMIRESLENRRA